MKTDPYLDYKEFFQMEKEKQKMEREKEKLRTDY
jgi:hypothetical protein